MRVSVEVGRRRAAPQCERWVVLPLRRVAVMVALRARAAADARDALSLPGSPTMPLHRTSLASALLVAFALPAHAQGLRDQIPDLFRFGDCGEPLCLAGSVNAANG